jgi:hypothetical protein
VRSVTDVVSDIFGNVQDIMRGEIRLATTELGNNLRGARSAAVLITVGAVSGFLSVFFILLGIVAALRAVMPTWLAALVVAVTLALIAAILLRVGTLRLQRRRGLPQTVGRIKETVQWSRPQTR